MSLSAPTLNPFSAVDTSTSGSGTVTLNVFLSPTDLSSNNLIQIEYNVYSTSTNESYSSGFLTSDSGITTHGIINQLWIVISTTNEMIDYSGDTVVKVRAYLGSTGTSQIGVTPWSLPVPFFNPPDKPSDVNGYIFLADENNQDDILSATITSDPNYFYNNELQVKFIVSYNYYDNSGNAVWKVSDLLNGNILAANPDIIFIDNIDLADDADITSHNMYMSVTAVYPYMFNNDNFYSLSEMSETVVVNPSEPTAPYLDSVVYNIYEDVNNPSLQTMSLTWSPSPTTGVNNFIPDSYQVFMSSTGGVDASNAPISGLLNGETFSFLWTIPSEFLSGTVPSTFTFTIVSSYDGDDFVSNSVIMNSYTPPGAPTNLNYRYATHSPNIVFEKDTDPSLIDMEFSFSVPDNVGQGSQLVFYYSVIDASGVTLETDTAVAYDASYNTYNVALNNLSSFLLAGTIQVWMNSMDTNSSTDYSSVVASILTSTTLGVNNMIYWFNTVTSKMSQYSFGNISTSDYVVNRTTSTNGQVVYEYEFYPSFFNSSTLPSSGLLIMTLSNASGIADSGLQLS
jgi:hypothetical protein